jgi:hypothetical protein
MKVHVGSSSRVGRHAGIGVLSAVPPPCSTCLGSRMGSLSGDDGGLPLSCGWKDAGGMSQSRGSNAARASRGVTQVVRERA